MIDTPTTTRFYTQGFKTSCIFMGVFGVFLIIAPLWFRQFVIETPMEQTCYIISFIGLVVSIIAVYGHQKNQPSLSFDANGVAYMQFAIKKVYIPWQDIIEIQYLGQSDDITHIYYLHVIDKNKKKHIISLSSPLKVNNITVTAKQAFEKLEKAFNNIPNLD